MVSHEHDIGRFFSSLQFKQVDSSYKGVGFSMKVVMAPMLPVATFPILQACFFSASWIA